MRLPHILLFCLCCSAISEAQEQSNPVPVIFDTDMTGDVDDALALAMIHTLADRGHCELIGVTVSKEHPLAASFIDAVNTFYGRPDIPIGVVQNGKPRSSKYLQVVEEKDGDSLRYPHDVKPIAAVPLLTELLENAKDNSVALISVGIATNLAQFLETDKGTALAKSKVRELSIMAGAFQTVMDGNRFLEANVVNDIPSMQKVASDWPGPIVWSGFEIGIAVPYPRESIAQDFNWVPHHIVKEAYLLHSGPEHDRPCWDLTSVLFSVAPTDDTYFTLSTQGRVDVEDSGAISFLPARQRNRPSDEPQYTQAEKKRDRFLKMTPTQAAAVQKKLVELVSAKPATFPQP